MADPIIDAAVDLKKALETDTPPDFQAKVKGPMDEIMKILLGAVVPPPKKNS
jgi:hypothetical protein